MQTIALNQVDAQKFTTNVSDQDINIRIMDRGDNGTFFDLYLNNTSIITGVLCLDRTFLVKYTYHNFKGDFMFVDTQGADAPQFTYYNTRFIFVYLTSDDVTSLKAS